MREETATGEPEHVEHMVRLFVGVLASAFIFIIYIVGKDIILFLLAAPITVICIYLLGFLTIKILGWLDEATER